MRILNCLIHLSWLFPYSPSLWTSGRPPSGFPPGCCLGTALPLDSPRPRNSELKEKGSKKSILPNWTGFPLSHVGMGCSPTVAERQLAELVSDPETAQCYLLLSLSSWKVDSPLSKHKQNSWGRCYASSVTAFICLSRINHLPSLNYMAWHTLEVRITS